GGHELHDAARTDAAARARCQVALGHSLRLEPAPVGTRAEVALGVLLEDRVEALALARGLSLARGEIERRERATDRGGVASRAWLCARHRCDADDRDEKGGAAHRSHGERGPRAHQPSALPMISAME